MRSYNNTVIREQALSATDMPASVARALTGSGIRTVGALMDTDAFKAVASGRYDIEDVRAINGIPIGALSWLVNEMNPAM